jgi:Fe-S-cluster-containing hydrogenase component 2
MSFPQFIKTFKAPATRVYSLKLLNHERDLEYNNDVCIGCGLCRHACPKQVITWGARADERIVVDAQKCVHCGICTWYCSAKALKLFINGEERVELAEKIDTIARKSLPRIEGVVLKHKKTGSLSIPPGLDVLDVNKAIATCHTGALSMEGTSLVLDEQKCIYCDACSKATGGKIIVSRTFLLVDMKDGVSPITKQVIERMLDVNASSRILKGVSGYKAREKTKTIVDTFKN